MPQPPAPTGPTEVERKMRSLAYTFVAKHKLPMGEVLINQFVRELQPALPRMRPPDHEAPGPKVPRGVRARAEALAGSREAAGRQAVRPLAGLSPASVPDSAPEPLSGPLRAVDDPSARRVLELLVDGMADKQIAREVGVSLTTAKRRVRAWLTHAEQPNRFALADWARRSGILDGAEAQR